MELNRVAIATGFVVTITLAVIGGLLIEGRDLPVLVTSWTVIGLLGGLAAGFVVGGTIRTGVVHGAVATLIGSLVTLAVVLISTLLFVGLLATFGVLLTGLLLLAFYALPGAVGGAIGSWTKGRRTLRRAAETSA